LNKSKNLVIIGDSAFAEIAYEYFQHDSEYSVVGFAVEKHFITKDKLFGLDIVPLEDIESFFAPDKTFFYAALVYTQLNRLRSRIYLDLKVRGYSPASYISKNAFIWPNVVLGEHLFIFEDNTIQPFTKIGDNTVIWSGNHIGHHSVIQKNCFIASHAVISGFCTIGSNSFIGVNATIANNVEVGINNWIGLNVTLTKSTNENELHKGPRSKAEEISSLEFFKVVE
jgi:sugar O-acyltransferase (sialic acid O-acetyltransferase NeuD family)